MSPSEATNHATRREWRELGFFYELLERPPCWRMIGSVAGLSNLVRVLDLYVRDSRNQTLSEHEHYGPYMYLKVQTSSAPAIDEAGIRGSLCDLARLRDLVAARLFGAVEGDLIVIGVEYAEAVTHALHLVVRAADFDPASEDPALAKGAV